LFLGGKKTVKTTMTAGTIILTRGKSAIVWKSWADFGNDSGMLDE